jgi:hypothetical protein
VLGVTATPARGDGRGLGDVFGDYLLEQLKPLSADFLKRHETGEIAPRMGEALNVAVRNGIVSSCGHNSDSSEIAFAQGDGALTAIPL